MFPRPGPTWALHQALAGPGATINTSRSPNGQSHVCVSHGVCGVHFIFSEALEEPWMLLSKQWYYCAAHWSESLEWPLIPPAHWTYNHIVVCSSFLWHWSNHKYLQIIGRATICCCCWICLRRLGNMNTSIPSSMCLYCCVCHHCWDAGGTMNNQRSHNVSECFRGAWGIMSTSRALKMRSWDCLLNRFWGAGDHECLQLFDETTISLCLSIVAGTLGEP